MQAPLVLLKAKEAYRIWHGYLININKIDRHTLGEKIDKKFLETLEILFKAIFTHDRFEKLSLVSQVIAKNDLLKFFLQLSWEEKILNHSTYGKLIILLEETGRMLGGWKKSLQEKTPTNK